MQRSELPRELREQGVFRTSEALTHGVTASRLRARDLDIPFPGLRSLVAATTLTERCRLLATRLHPMHVFSHATAAALIGMPLPWSTPDDLLHVSAIPPAREPRLDGIVGHRMRLDAAHLTLAEGVPVPVPSEIWAQLGALLCPRGCGRSHRRADEGDRARAQVLHELDLLIAADWLLASGTTKDELADALARVRRRGGRALERALDDARPGSESPKETETRLVLMRAGLPEPEINATLLDAHGRFVARLDLGYPEYRVAIEYDGRHHADAAQFTRDADRWAAIEAEGWILVRVLSHHLETPGPSVLSRVRRALLSRGWRP